MEKKRVLITIKTYPLPSATHQELVCTAGVLEDGSFIRLYPIDYRYRPYWQWYKKYQWIEVEVEKHERDPRKESYRPKVDTIRPLGEPLATANKWAERRRFVLGQGAKTMEDLCALQKSDRTSLGIVRPAEVTDFLVKPASREWKPKWKALFEQRRLFGPQQKPLERIPFKFSYEFKCGPSNCNGHRLMIEDWEVCQLYRKERDRLGSAEKACESIRAKFFEQMCSATKDTHFFVGTTLQHASWIILGVFWPPK